MDIINVFQSIEIETVFMEIEQKKSHNLLHNTTIVSVPEIDEENIMIDIITVDDVVDNIQEKASENMLNKWQVVVINKQFY